MSARGVGCRGVGKNLQGPNLVNISAVLFMWVTLPAYGAASYGAPQSAPKPPAPMLTTCAHIGC